MPDAKWLTLRSCVALCFAVAATVLALSLCIPEYAFATPASKGAKVYKLRPDVTYTSYDITGDKKPDTIWVSVDDRENGYYDSVAVYINGKRAYSKKRIGNAAMVDGIAIELIKLKNGKPFLYLATYGDDDNCDVCAIFRYKSGKLKTAIDCNKYFSSNYGMHRSASLSRVTGNTVVIGYSLMSWAVGPLRTSAKYSYKSGVLKKSSNTPAITVGGQRGSYRAAKSITLYKSQACKSKKLVVRKGQSVKFSKIYSNGKTMSIQLKVGKKTGWLKCQNFKGGSVPANWWPPFEGLFLAG